jgi:hypothetical protein
VSKQAANYHAYLLRLWRSEADRPWRASLEDSKTGVRRGFKNLTMLCEFLQQQIGEKKSTQQQDVQGKVINDENAPT